MTAVLTNSSEVLPHEVPMISQTSLRETDLRTTIEMILNSLLELHMLFQHSGSESTKACETAEWVYPLRITCLVGVGTRLNDYRIRHVAATTCIWLATAETLTWRVTP
jgi:hypothetical protein